jgi:alkylation response protein AidB-like acyl-CoA dehydrogenase
MHGTLATVPVCDADSLIKAAKSLGSEINTVRDELDRQRRLPAALVEAMRAAELPTALGGPALNVIEFIRVIEELARFDGMRKSGLPER